MTLLKDLIDIPDRVHKGDYVLKLTEGVTDPAETLKEYVVTPELRGCFDAALNFIRSAVQNRTSKATYLHGSFGSGKSHFMAVLHLILQGNPAARGIPELAPVIQKHNEWLAGKKFLLVPFHMIGAHDMESGILGNYVEFMRKNHPEAPIPPVYMSAAIISEAAAERANYGDEPFFKRLNGGTNGGTDWGELEAPWDARSFEAAAAAPPDSESHLRLVSTLLKTVATSHVEVISHRGGNFVRFDKGLALMSQHAKALGYDALVLFLDELILWLAMHSADLDFVKNEAAKLTNLVEAQSADRPIPLVSFVARQRDLRELVGDHVPGAERLSFADSLDWQQGRFDTITLEDRNLPAIAEKRVLKCKSKAARDELDAAFEQTARMKDSVMTILLTQEGDRQMFKQVYPFSPALIQTLIAVSSVLQRERTALKVMVQLLVDQRETLKVGDILPVGDLFDVVAHGDEAFSPDMAIHFDNAKRLYHQKLLPAIEKEHGVRREEVEKQPYDAPKRAAFRSDDRLVKTLLSALVPEVESLRGLNAERLAALNFGSIKTPVSGREAQEVLRRCRNWNITVGEIRIGEGLNPTISVQLSGVDTQSIIEQARREDNTGNRIRRVRQLLFDQLQIEGEEEFEQFHEFRWRGTKRSCSVLFRNIRELPESSLENGDESWRLVVDFPFDEPGRGPRDDLGKLQQFRHSHPGGAKTICWVPSFLSDDALADLGLLVILEHILSGERFGQYANHLSPQDRQAAKSLLENQLSVLRQRVQSHLDAAYGLDGLSAGSLDTSHDLEPSEHYQSLFPGFAPQPPVAANLAGATQVLLSQALEHEFPAAPNFETELKIGILKKVYEQIAPAAQTADGRVLVEKTTRQVVRQIANPLWLGEMDPDATHFVLGQHWKNHFSRQAAMSGGAITVEKLRNWLDDPRPMGLPKEAQNLVILLYALQTSQTFYLHGGVHSDVGLASIPDLCELRKVDFPPQDEWESALKRAASIFGLTISRLLNASNLSHLTAEVKKKASDARPGCQTYYQQLKERLNHIGVAADSADRLKTAIATQVLVDRLSAVEANSVVKLLARAEIATSEAAMGECVAKGAVLAGNLSGAAWDLFDAIGLLKDDRQPAAGEVLADLRQALISDEHVVQLGPALKAAQARAVRLLAKPADPPPRPPPGRRVVDRGTKNDLTLPAAKDVLASVADKVKPSQNVRFDLNWVIDEECPPS